MSSLQVVPIRDEAALRQWHAVEVVANAADYEHLPADPIEDRLPLLAGEPAAGELTLLRLALKDGVPVGIGSLSLPVLDNLSSATVEVIVHPQQRRRGHGRDLLNALLAELKDTGRSRIFFELPSPWPDGGAAGAPLARSVGAREVLSEVRRLLDLSGELPDAVAPPSPYRVVQWLDRAPDELVDDVAALEGRMATDIPLGDMEWEPEVWDAARYRAKEAFAAARGRVRMATAAVDGRTGRAVAYTDIGVNGSQPEVGYQWDTIVDPEHRRPWPGPGHQVAQPAAAAGAAAGHPLGQHLERRKQHPHGGRERRAGLPPGRSLDGVAARSLIRGPGLQPPARRHGCGGRCARRTPRRCGPSRRTPARPGSAQRPRAGARRPARPCPRS